MIKLIVGLGNPGIEYELTRHNIAWLFLDGYEHIRSNNWKEKFKGEYTDFNLKGNKTYVLKPMTFMNLSGESVQPLCKFFKINIDEILVIHDEIDLPFGQLHFKKGGGLAGHNGLKSIAQVMGGDGFYRMRLGVGRPSRGSVSSWVLSKFPSSMDIELNLYMEKATEALDKLLIEGFKKASNEYNKKNLLEMKK